MFQQLLPTALKLPLAAIRAACFQLATSEMVAVTAAFLDLFAGIEDTNPLPNKLRAARMRTGLSQEDVASIIDKPATCYRAMNGANAIQTW